MSVPQKQGPTKMKKTFRYISTAQNNTIRFANIAKPSETLSFHSERQRVNRTGVAADIVRNTIVKTNSISLSQVNCTDNCAPQGVFTRSIRLETSHPTTSVELVAELEEVLAYLKTNTSVFNGFNPPASVDILLGDA